MSRRMRIVRSGGSAIGHGSTERGSVYCCLRNDLRRRVPAIRSSGNGRSPRSPADLLLATDRVKEIFCRDGGSAASAINPHRVDAHRAGTPPFLHCFTARLSSWRRSISCAIRSSRSARWPSAMARTRVHGAPPALATSRICLTSSSEKPRLCAFRMNPSSSSVLESYERYPLALRTTGDRSPNAS